MPTVQEHAFQEMMDKLAERGWPDGNTGNFSCWWDIEGGGEIHLFMRDDLGFLVGTEKQAGNLVRTIKSTADALDKIRAGRQVQPAIKKDQEP